ncbi:hypothetical protein [Streptomyces sp. L2]|uniref:hypothetical protein n=1 Tax=Streptomyces sp. L2 TaxID=2162665 RepID=UPI00101080BC|nr:hypothetical protein [Streptomyces sp. L2]
MSSPPYLIDESALSEDADVWFVLPPGFVPLPLQELAIAEQNPAVASRLADALRPLFEAGADNAAKQRLLTALGPVLRVAQVLLSVDTVHCCIGLHADDIGDGDLLLSMFTLTWKATNWAPRRVLVARALAGAQGTEYRERLDLPCGPAALVQSRLTGPSEVGPVAGRRLLQITAHVPCTEGRRIAMLTLATTAIERAQEYRCLLRDIARSLSFENPLADQRTEE